MHYESPTPTQITKQRRTQRMLWSAATLLAEANATGRTVTCEELALRAQIELLGASVIAKANVNAKQKVRATRCAPTSKSRGSLAAIPLSNLSEVELALAAICRA